MTPYSLLISLTGLSHKDAAALHGVRPDTVKSWIYGRRNAPPGALNELRELIDRIEKMANQVIEYVQDMDVPDDMPLEIAYCATDAEAKARGLPFAACHHVVIAQALSALYNPATLVPVSKSTAALANATPKGTA
ncbi:MAG: hypothetical protein P1U37_15395 [Minwuia sp.]|nr:hypothetical protein [Minwuia sp.]